MVKVLLDLEHSGHLKTHQTLAVCEEVQMDFEELRQVSYCKRVVKSRIMALQAIKDDKSDDLVMIFVNRVQSWTILEGERRMVTVD